MQSNSAQLELKNVHLDLHQHKILENISVKIKQGSRTAIMGLNGAGKTSLLKIMSGVLLPDSGGVYWDGQDYGSLSVRERARLVGYIAQDEVAHFPFTVEETVLMGLYPLRKSFFHSAGDGALARESMERLQLLNLAQRDVCTLSGGEKQRVWLARALTQQTRMLLLDEPLNHLDIKNERYVMRVIDDINRNKGVTIVAVMHDLAMARRYFDDVILLKEGRLVLHGQAVQALNPENILKVFEVEEV